MNFIYGLLVGAALGYGFRGAINKELKVIGADVKAELVVIRTKIEELLTALKAKV